MKKDINLFWYKHPSGNKNFGDVLNPYIISKLTDCNIKYYNIRYYYDNKWLALKVIGSALKNRLIGFKEMLTLLKMNFIIKPKVVTAIGSVLEACQSRNIIVWGSGVIRMDSNFIVGKVLACRGEKTRERLIQLGFEAPHITGDPAILLPLIYKPVNVIKYRVGVIPHFSHYEYLKNSLPKDILVINLFDEIENVINEIGQCEYTLSTSLHGIIVSHAYGIKSIWTCFKNLEIKLIGDNSKFHDYFSSVDLQVKEPLLIDEQNFNEEELHNVLKNQAGFLLPEMNKIVAIQNGLLSSAPFEIKNT